MNIQRYCYVCDDPADAWRIVGENCRLPLCDAHFGEALDDAIDEYLPDEPTLDIDLID